MLDAQSIIAAGEARAGAADPEPHLHANLDALIGSLNSDGKLDADGAASAERALIARTAERIEGTLWVERHPEIAEQEVTAPLFLTGLPRSGTTYFQFLVDRDVRFRQVRSWQALGFSPPPGGDPDSVESRKAFEAEIRKRMQPREIEGFEALHLIDEDGPDECHAILEQAYAAAGFFNLYDAPGFFAYLMDDLDLVAAYRVHKRQLQLLQWRQEPRRWAVKYPNHTIAMDAIVQVYPDARFAMTHRDPAQVVASIAKMTLALRGARYANVDPHRIGAQMRGFIRRHVDRIMAFDASPEGERVTHIDYYALVADPVTELRRVNDALGIGTPEDIATEISGWRRENPKNKRGANDYALTQFGLDRDDLAELFADYTARFGIPPEREGVARISGDMSR